MLKILSYPRSILAALVYPIFLGGCSIYAIVQNLLLNNRKLDDSIIQFWGRVSCWMFGVKIEVGGLQNVPQGGCLYLFNHTSFFDIFVMSAVLRGVRFGAKIELFKIPFFGMAMRRLGVLPIARDRREEVFRIYKAAEARIKNGERFALAPEGTRQTVERLGSFKAGPFVFAINARAPVVPIVILNAVHILPKGQIFPNWGVWKRTIRLEVLPAVSTESLEVQNRPQLQEGVRKMMEPFFAADNF